jgi:ABC-type antimicrobial peptide transport system permease subunit
MDGLQYLNVRIEAEGMVVQLFGLFIGFGLAVSGGVSLIMYLNLLTTGMTFTDYISFVSTRVESYLFLLGILIITLSIYIPRRKI